MASLRSYKTHLREPDKNEKWASYGQYESKVPVRGFFSSSPESLRQPGILCSSRLGAHQTPQVLTGVWALSYYRDCCLLAGLFWVGRCSINWVTEKYDLAQTRWFLGVKRWSKMHRIELWDLRIRSISFKRPETPQIDVPSSWDSACREPHMHISRFWQIQKHGGSRNLCGVCISTTLGPNRTVSKALNRL